MEVSLGRLVCLRVLEDNTQCIAAIRLRHLLGFTPEVFFPDHIDPDAPQYIRN